MASPDLPDWNAELFRLTAFTSSTLDSTAVDSWQKLTGVPPESISSKPTLGVYSAEGAAEGFRLILSIAPGRVDWMFVAQPSAEDPFADIGPLMEKFPWFSGRSVAWLKMVNFPIERIAVGMIVRNQVEDRIAGYKMLSDLLPTVKIDPENSSDLQYQVNRPKISTQFGEIKLNRIAKWGVASVGLIPVGSKATGPQTFFCRVELDLSTDQESKLDMGKNSGSVFEELAKHGIAIIKDGDIA